MKSVLVALACAGAVVLLYLLLDPGEAAAGEPLPEGLPRRGTRAAPPVPVPQRSGPDPESVSMDPRREPPPPVIDDRLHGLVGEALVELQRAVSGLTPRAILQGRRKEMQAAIHKARVRLKKEDVEYLVRKFEAVEDPGFRYAMLWLFRYVRDDRVVEPAASLVASAPVEVVETLAAVATPHAIRTLAELADGIESPGIRGQIYDRVGRSSWRGAEDYLALRWKDAKLPAEERLQALAAMGQRPPATALVPVLEVALGPPVPLEGLGTKMRQWGDVADLRAAAVRATMSLDDQSAVLRLMDEADRRDHDPDLARLVQRNLVAYEGPSLVTYLLERAKRRAAVSFGEAVYLGQHCTRADVAPLEDLRSLATDERTRQALTAAIVRAQRR